MNGIPNIDELDASWRPGTGWSGCHIEDYEGAMAKIELRTSMSLSSYRCISQTSECVNLQVVARRWPLEAIGRAITE